MTQLAYVWRLLREVSLAHLLAPLLVTLLIDTAWGRFVSREIAAIDRVSLEAYWAEHLLTLFGHYVVFLVVFMALLVRGASVADVNIEILEDLVPQAKSYHAFGMIPLKQWFEPAVIGYLFRLVDYTYRSSGALTHRRVMLFLSRTDYLATKANYLDADFARLFADIHRRAKVPLAFLERPKCVKAILSLGDSEISALGWFRRWLPMSILRRTLAHGWVPVRWTLRKAFTDLPFAVIDLTMGDRLVLQFAHEGKSLRLEPMTDPACVAAHIKLADLLTEAVVNPQGGIASAHDFTRHY